MRGQPKSSKSLILTGTVYLKYEDDEQIETAKAGDVMLYLHTDNTHHTLIKGDYYARGYAGYFKADIFDGKHWQILDITDFCEAKEHYFSKSECAIDTYMLCKEILEGKAGTEVYKGYRGGHYSTYLHEPNAYKGKKGVKKSPKQQDEED